jgi:hypothetical protein
MSVFRIRPARNKAEEAMVVSNLDRLISNPVGVILHGKKRIIKQMTTNHFLVVSRELHELDMLRRRSESNEVLDEKEVAQKHCDLFKSCVEPFDSYDMDKMTYPQIAALFQVILDCVGGKAQVVEEKKNLTPTTHTTQ